MRRPPPPSALVALLLFPLVFQRGAGDVPAVQRIKRADVFGASNEATMTSSPLR